LFFKAAPSRLSSAMPSSFASVFCRVSLKLNETFVIAAILILPPPVLLLLAKKIKFNTAVTLSLNAI